MSARLRGHRLSNPLVVCHARSFGLPQMRGSLVEASSMRRICRHVGYQSELQVHAMPPARGDLGAALRGRVPRLVGTFREAATAVNPSLDSTTSSSTCISSPAAITMIVQGPFEMHKGFLRRGGDIFSGTMTLEEAKLKARTLPGCKAFTYKGDLLPDAEDEFVFFFKDQAELVDHYDGNAWATVLYEADRDSGRAALLAGDFSEVEEKPVEPPSPAQLRMMFAASALPFVGFGFLDNFLMILFGELIDASLCVAFNFSTMAAAAIGNTISDTAGIFSGGAVEELAKKFGVEEPRFDNRQKNLPVTKYWQYTGQCLGIVFGCILGSCPLLWMDAKEGERLKREKQKQEVFQSVILKVQKILGAEAVALLFTDRDSKFVRSTHHTDNLPNFRQSVDAGFIGHVVKTGHFVNIADMKDEPLYDPNIHDDYAGSGIKVRSILCLPIFSEDQAVGAVACFNKEGDMPFTSEDEDVLSAITSHISVAMCDEERTFEHVIEMAEKSMRKSGSKEWSMSGETQRMQMIYDPAVAGIRTVVGAESAVLLLWDRESHMLDSEVIDGPIAPHSTMVGEGAVGQAAERGLDLRMDSVSLGSPLDPAGAVDFDGCSIDVRSELAVPLFDARRKCLGAIRCINKVGGDAFTDADVEYAREAAKHLEMMLEGPDAGLRRLLLLSRKTLQKKQLDEIDQDSGTVTAYLKKAEKLPARAGFIDRPVDPYVTLSITQGNPLNDQESGLAQQLARERNMDRHSAVRRFAKSDTILEDRNPRWDQKMALPMPTRCHDLPKEDLFVHLLVWDYYSLEPDRLIGQAVIPLNRLGHGTAQTMNLLPVAGQEGQYNLFGSTVTVAFPTES